MKTATLYHRASGAIIGLLRTADDEDLSPYETAQTGVLLGGYDADTQYVVDASPATLAARTEVAPLVADGVVGTVVTVTGLPDPCWLLSGSAVVASIGGTFTFTPSEARVYAAELVGAWRGSVTVNVRGVDDVALAADPRWQALQAATPAQIEAWLAANVTNLAEARVVLKLLLLAVRKLGA